MRAAQAVGLRLGEIREVIALRDWGEPPCGFVAELIAARVAELDERLAELEAPRDTLRALARRAEQLDPGSRDPRLVCHIIDDMGT